MKLVLASQSPARRRLLKRLGYSFSCKPAHLDEAGVARRIQSPRKLVRELARMKTRVIADQNPLSVVIGSDQILLCNRRVFGKPKTAARARAQLRAMAGRKVYLLTAICVIDQTREIALILHESILKVRRLTHSEVREYVALDSPLECAGSFKFECAGIGLFESVQTDDPTAIEGLPLIHLGKVLRSIRHA